MKHRLWTVASVALTLLCGCSIIGGGGGTGVESPFFDGADTRRDGTLDGYVLAPIEAGGEATRSLVLSAYPGDPSVYRLADGARVTLGDGTWRTSDAKGFYSFDSLRPGSYEIEATDSTGAYSSATATVEVSSGAITSAPLAPVPAPEVRSTEYFSVGADDYMRFTSVRGTRDWRRADLVAADAAGVYRFSFGAPGGAQEDAYTDLTFGSDGVVWHGGEWGTLSPGVSWLADSMRLGDSFTLTTTLEDPNGGEPRTAQYSSVLVGVDDLVLPAGRFDNCPKVEIGLTADGVSVNWTLWLAYRVGPVKMLLDGVDYQATSGRIGATTYP